MDVKAFESELHKKFPKATVEGLADDALVIAMPDFDGCYDEELYDQGEVIEEQVYDVVRKYGGLVSMVKPRGDGWVVVIDGAPWADEGEAQVIAGVPFWFWSSANEFAEWARGFWRVYDYRASKGRSDCAGGTEFRRVVGEAIAGGIGPGVLHEFIDERANALPDEVVSHLRSVN